MQNVPIYWRVSRRMSIRGHVPSVVCGHGAEDEGESGLERPSPPPHAKNRLEGLRCYFGRLHSLDAGVLGCEPFPLLECLTAWRAREDVDSPTCPMCRGGSPPSGTTLAARQTNSLDALGIQTGGALRALLRQLDSARGMDCRWRWWRARGWRLGLELG